MQHNSNQKLSPAAAMIILVCVMIIFTISLLYISNQKPKVINSEKNNTANTNTQSDSTEKTTDTSTADPITTKYSNSTYNLTIDFASAFKSSSLANDNGTRIDFNLTDWKAVLLIDAPMNEELIRSMYEIGQEDDITINGITATRIIGSSIKDASLTYIYIFTHEEKLYVFYSTSANIQSVAKTISFSK